MPRYERLDEEDNPVDLFERLNSGKNKNKQELMKFFQKLAKSDRKKDILAIIEHNNRKDAFMDSSVVLNAIIAVTQVGCFKLANEIKWCCYYGSKYLAEIIVQGALQYWHTHDNDKNKETTQLYFLAHFDATFIPTLAKQLKKSSIDVSDNTVYRATAISLQLTNNQDLDYEQALQQTESCVLPGEISQLTDEHLQMIGETYQALSSFKSKSSSKLSGTFFKSHLSEKHQLKNTIVGELQAFASKDLKERVNKLIECYQLLGRQKSKNSLLVTTMKWMLLSFYNNLPPSDDEQYASENSSLLTTKATVVNKEIINALKNHIENLELSNSDTHALGACAC